MVYTLTVGVGREWKGVEASREWTPHLSLIYPRPQESVTLRSRRIVADVPGSSDRFLRLNCLSLLLGSPFCDIKLIVYAL